jgi:hypothetical protein
MSEKARVLGTAGGALGLGAFAAAIGACCGFPWAVALLGVGGAVALARLSFLPLRAARCRGTLGCCVLVGLSPGCGLRRWNVQHHRDPPPLADHGLGGDRAGCRDGDRSVDFGMRRESMRILPSAFMAGCLLVLTSGCAKESASGTAAYTVLDDHASQLRADFNRKVGSVRLLFVVDPICPGCLRGLADMNRDLLRSTADPRLQIYVVHEPVLGVARYAPWLRVAGGRDVPEAGALLEYPNVLHYWNPTGAFGRLLSKAVGLKNGEEQVYAWDVWLIYGPDAKWVGTGPPRPRLLMHQLSELRGTEFPHLDSRVFAQQVQTLLAQLPPATSTALADQAHP